MTTPQTDECTNCNGYDSSTCPFCRGTGEQPKPLDLDAIQGRLNATSPAMRLEMPEAIDDITALLAEVHRLRGLLDERTATTTGTTYRSIGEAMGAAMAHNARMAAQIHIARSAQSD